MLKAPRPQRERECDLASGSAAVIALSVLGDATRRSILERLAEGPLNVGQITDRVTVTQSAVSQHLRVMKKAGLVTEEARGTRRVYRLDPRGIAEMREWLDNVWSKALETFRDFADANAEPEVSK